MNRVTAAIAALLALLAASAGIQSCSESSTVPVDDTRRAERCRRTPLGPPTGSVLSVSTLAELEAAVEQANASGDATVMLADGDYELQDELRITGDRIAVRGASGRRDAVTIRGRGMDGSVTHVFQVFGDAFTVADMTIGWAQDHAVELVYDNDDALFHNVRFVDTGAHMLKVAYTPGMSECADSGRVEWCLFEYTAGIGPTSYIGGIDARYARDWIVRHNVFRYIRSPEGLPSGFAVLFRSQSCGTTIEYNTVFDCDRGIGLGLGGGGHSWGLVANNAVHTSRDVGMRLENAYGTRVYNNTLFTAGYDNSIEYRYDATREIEIVNNLASAAIVCREGATGTVENNVTAAPAAWFAGAAAGDLHLAVADTTVVGRGRMLPEVTHDFDCQARPRGTGADIGADEI